MEWSWPAWAVSIAAVVVAGTTAWLEGNWVRRPGLAMGFANHGGMWGDLLLLPIANAVIVPHLTVGVWWFVALGLASAVSALVHVHWYRGQNTTHSPEHMWPVRVRGSWSGDLSRAGWLHVVFVAAELGLLAGFLVHPMPAAVVLVVCAVFTIHVPIGLLQPRWFVTRRVASFRQQPLLLPCVGALWLVTFVKLALVAGAL